MATYNKIFNAISALAYQINFKTGAIVFFLFVENLYICIWSVSIFLFILIFLNINIDYLCNFDSMFLSIILQNSYNIFKYLFILNIFLILTHLYVSIKHILLDYIRDIDDILMYLFYILINYTILLVIILYFYQLNLNNISFLLQNILAIFFISFFSFITYFFINKSISLIITNKKNSFISHIFYKNYFIIICIPFFLFIIYYTIIIGWKLNPWYIDTFNIPYFEDWYFDYEAILAACNTTFWNNELMSNFYGNYWHPIVYVSINVIIGGWVSCSSFLYTKFINIILFFNKNSIIIPLYQKFNFLNINYFFKYNLSTNIEINKFDLEYTQNFIISNLEYTKILEFLFY